MLEITKLDAFYGDSHILFGLEMRIETGQRVALLGRNGAGKSTFLKSVMNAEPNLNGSIRWQGRDLKGVPPHELARLGFAFVPEDRRIVGNMTVMENLRLAYTGTPADRRTASPAEVLDLFEMLQPIRDRSGGVLSGGQQQLLALARASITNPHLLLLDEPTEGLAPVIVEELARDVQRICRVNNCTLILCEQNVWFSRSCTDYVYVLDSGQIVFSGSWADFDANPAIQKKHLTVA